ncbi:hypothetical protein LEMLEM_LOCUS8313, partial [Lemmus lemmus]
AQDTGSGLLGTDLVPSEHLSCCNFLGSLALSLSLSLSPHQASIGTGDGVVNHF